MSVKGTISRVDVPVIALRVDHDGVSLRGGTVGVRRPRRRTDTNSGLISGITSGGTETHRTISCLGDSRITRTTDRVARNQATMLEGTGARRDRTNQRDEQKHRGWWTSETATRYIYREHRGKTAETQDPLLPKPVYTPPWTRLAMREGRNTHTDSPGVQCRLANWHATPSQTR